MENKEENIDHKYGKNRCPYPALFLSLFCMLSLQTPYVQICQNLFAFFETPV